ncbi:unnamed protein product, partial [Mesorhabditis spiculigera]
MWQVGVASAASLAALLLALASIGAIVNDINDMDAEIREGLAHFDVEVNSAWSRVYSAHVYPAGNPVSHHHKQYNPVQMPHPTSNLCSAARRGATSSATVACNLVDAPPVP